MRPHGRFAFWSIWVIFAAGFLICRVWLFDSVFYNIDEAEYAVSAQALTQGLLPGADLVGSTKPPGIVFLYAGIFALFGDSLLPLQWTGFILWLVLLLLAVRLSKHLVPAVPEWMSAACFFLLANSFGLPRDMHALNVELPAMVLALAALLLSVTSGKSRNLLVAGILLGLAIMCRQSMALFIIAALLFLNPSTLKRVAILFAGILLPWLALLLFYGANNSLALALDSWIRYPILYSGDTGVEGFFEAFWLNSSELVRQAFMPILFSLLGFFVAARTRQTKLLALLFASVGAVTAGSRFFGHYYIQVMPALAILGGIGLQKLLSSSVRVKRVAQALLAIGALLTLLHFPLWRYWDEAAPPKGTSAESLDGHGLEIELARFAAQNSTPDQSIFVWGYCPQIYFHANRLPGVRDFLCHYVTGYSAGTTHPRANACADAEQMFIEDLKQSRPKLLFDLSFSDYYPYSFADFPLTKYPDLARYVQANYQPMAQVGSVPIYSLVSGD